MRTSDQVACLTELEELIGLVKSGRAAAVSKLDEWSAGFPGGGDGGGGKGGHSDRTGVLATRADPFQQARTTLDQNLKLARDALFGAHQIILVATSFEQQDETIEWCRSCIRLLNHKGEPHHSPVASDHMCRWCGDFKRQYKRWPDVRILEYRARYGRVTEQVVALYARTPA